MCFNLDHALNAIIRLPDLASFGQNLENLAKELKNAQVNHRFDISPDASRTISSSLDKIDEIVGNLSNPNVNFHFDQLQEIIEVLKKIGTIINRLDYQSLRQSYEKVYQQARRPILLRPPHNNYNWSEVEHYVVAKPLPLALAYEFIEDDAEWTLRVGGDTFHHQIDEDDYSARLANQIHSRFPVVDNDSECSGIWAIIGVQRVGKSTTMNELLKTNFVTAASQDQKRVTKGIDCYFSSISIQNKQRLMCALDVEGSNSDDRFADYVFLKETHEREALAEKQETRLNLLSLLSSSLVIALQKVEKSRTDMKALGKLVSAMLFLRMPGAKLVVVFIGEVSNLGNLFKAFKESLLIHVDSEVRQDVDTVLAQPSCITAHPKLNNAKWRLEISQLRDHLWKVQGNVAPISIQKICTQFAHNFSAVLSFDASQVLPSINYQQVLAKIALRKATIYAIKVFELGLKDDSILNDVEFNARSEQAKRAFCDRYGDECPTGPENNLNDVTRHKYLIDKEWPRVSDILLEKFNTTYRRCPFQVLCETNHVCRFNSRETNTHKHECHSNCCLVRCSRHSLLCCHIDIIDNPKHKNAKIAAEHRCRDCCQTPCPLHDLPCIIRPDLLPNHATHYCHKSTQLRCRNHAQFGCPNLSALDCHPDGFVYHCGCVYCETHKTLKIGGECCRCQRTIRSIKLTFICGSYEKTKASELRFNLKHKDNFTIATGSAGGGCDWKYGDKPIVQLELKDKTIVFDDLQSPHLYIDYSTHGKDSLFTFKLEVHVELADHSEFFDVTQEGQWMRQSNSIYDMHINLPRK